jgi:hypothetical protein
MLKIKDNVDLKELEKFGMIQNKFNEYYDFPDKCGILDFYINESRYLLDDYGDKVVSKDLDTLYDLIKADLVEKVSDDND